MSRHIRYGYTESSPDGGYIYRTVHHRPVHHPPRSRDSGRDRYSLSSYNSSYLSYDNSRRYYTLSAAHNACMRTAAGLRPVTVYFADAPRGRGRGRGRGSYFPPPRDRYDHPPTPGRSTRTIHLLAAVTARRLATTTAATAQTRTTPTRAAHSGRTGLTRMLR
ncbi:hypothetical protein EDC01DRAFT_285428 [Geopyxis carbonaria]|nr:hypothetical protein EDC01DRAFT_285428 [Geopyxis carbonaria]